MWLSGHTTDLLLKMLWRRKNWKQKVDERDLLEKLTVNVGMSVSIFWILFWTGDKPADSSRSCCSFLKHSPFMLLKLIAKKKFKLYILEHWSKVTDWTFFLYNFNNLKKNHKINIRVFWKNTKKRRNINVKMFNPNKSYYMDFIHKSMSYMPL